MPNWIIKSIVQHVISCVPNRHAFNEWFQNNVTRSLGLNDGAFEKRLDFSRRYLEDFWRLQPAKKENFTVFELGTGWYPTCMIALYLCGAGDSWTFDVKPLLKTSRLKMLFDCFCRYDDEGRLKTFLPALRADRMAILRGALKYADTDTPAAMLERIKCRVVVGDAQQTGLRSKSIDFIFSTAVLEYIPAFILKNVFKEFLRIGVDAAVLALFIDLKDQFAATDRSITPLNFLRYSSAAWKWLDSPLITQSRLRVSNYRAIANECGYEIIKEEDVSASPDLLEQIKLAPEFQKYSAEDLLVIETWMVLQPARSAEPLRKLQ